MVTTTTTGGEWEWNKPATTQPQPLHVCPHCGYCPHCGRGGYQPQPAPWYPAPYYPSWPTYPTYQWTWPGSGIVIC